MIPNLPKDNIQLASYYSQPLLLLNCCRRLEELEWQQCGSHTGQSDLTL
jgi:hypothetical protein